MLLNDSYANSLTELALWLVCILIGTFLINSLALYLVILFVIYFLVVRTLEKVTVGRLHEKSVLITGCDTGFGPALVIKCLRTGMPVFAACSDDSGRRRLLEEMSSIPNSEQLLEAFVLDVRNEDSIQKAKKLVESRLSDEKQLWAVVNNAEIDDMRGWNDWITPAVYERLWDVNTLGVIRVTHAFRNLLKRSKGRIVNMGSIAAKLPMPFMPAYSVSKVAVAGFTDVIRAEYSQWSVKVVLLEPGFFKTAQADPAAITDDIARVWERTPQSVKNEYGEEYFKWSQQTIADYLDCKCKPNGCPVVEAYFSAITSAFPRCCYQIGLDTIFQFGLLSCLPSRWQEWIFCAYYHLVAKPPTRPAEH